MEKELDWYRCRYLGIVTRTSLTDAIKDQYEHEWDRKSSIYADFTDLEYITLYGFNKKGKGDNYGIGNKIYRSKCM